MTTNKDALRFAASLEKGAAELRLYDSAQSNNYAMCARIIRNLVEKNEALSASKPETSEADDLLRRLGLDPEQYRTDGGYINHLKVKAAIRYPDSYPRIDQCQHEFIVSADFGGRICKLCGKPERVWSKQEHGEFDKAMDRITNTTRGNA